MVVDLENDVKTEVYVHEWRKSPILHISITVGDKEKPSVIRIGKVKTYAILKNIDMLEGFLEHYDEYREEIKLRGDETEEDDNEGD